MKMTISKSLPKIYTGPSISIIKDPGGYLRAVLTCLLLSFVLMITGCSKDLQEYQDPVPSKEEASSDKEENEQGTTVIDTEKAVHNYRNHCGGCHGQNLVSFVERQWIYGHSPEAVQNSIIKGYVKNGMPAYGSTFSEQGIRDLANYILSEIKGKTKKMLEESNPDLSGSITSDDLTFRVETLAKVPGVPWGIGQLPTGELLVTERGGRLFLVNTKKELKEINGIPEVVSEGQGGLMDVAVHPDFKNNSLIYLSHTIANPNNPTEKTTAVARAKLSENSLEQVERIFTALPYLETDRHYGSRLLFDRDGYLFVSIGDRGYRDSYPQKLDNHLGKVHRIRDDGQAPNDNPFYNTQGAVKSIFTYGTRNPQGLSQHPVTGAIWEGEHGPQGGDEINLL